MTNANETKAKAKRARCEKCLKVRAVADEHSCDCHTFGFCAECVAATTEDERRQIMNDAWTEHRHARHCDMWF